MWNLLFLAQLTSNSTNVLGISRCPIKGCAVWQNGTCSTGGVFDRTTCGGYPLGRQDLVLMSHEEFLFNANTSNKNKRLDLDDGFIHFNLFLPRTSRCTNPRFKSGSALMTRVQSQSFKRIMRPQGLKILYCPFCDGSRCKHYTSFTWRTCPETSSRSEFWVGRIGSGIIFDLSTFWLSSPVSSLLPSPFWQTASEFPRPSRYTRANHKETKIRPRVHVISNCATQQLASEYY